MSAGASSPGWSRWRYKKSFTVSPSKRGLVKVGDSTSPSRTGFLVSTSSPGAILLSCWTTTTPVHGEPVEPRPRASRCETPLSNLHGMKPVHGEPVEPRARASTLVARRSSPGIRQAHPERVLVSCGTTNTVHGEPVEPRPRASRPGTLPLSNLRGIKPVHGEPVEPRPRASTLVARRSSPGIRQAHQERVLVSCGTTKKTVHGEPFEPRPRTSTLVARTPSPGIRQAHPERVLVSCGTKKRSR
jgi:hypothetical protein